MVHKEHMLNIKKKKETMILKLCIHTNLEGLIPRKLKLTNYLKKKT